eukprot:Opistho-2@89666
MFKLNRHADRSFYNDQAFHKRVLSLIPRDRIAWNCDLRIALNCDLRAQIQDSSGLSALDGVDTLNLRHLRIGGCVCIWPRPRPQPQWVGALGGCVCLGRRSYS